MTDITAPVIQIGGVAKDVLGEAAEAVIRVATCSPDRDVTVAALTALTQLGETKHVTLTGCTVVGHNPQFEDEEDLT